MTSVIPKDFIESISEKFRMLADSSRLYILNALMSSEMNVGEIVKATGLSQANVSKHLRLLTTAQLLSRRKAGLSVFYRIKDPIIKQICMLVCKSILSDLQLSRRRKLPSLKRQTKGL